MRRTLASLWAAVVCWHDGVLPLGLVGWYAGTRSST